MMRRLLAGPRPTLLGAMLALTAVVACGGGGGGSNSSSVGTSAFPTTVPTTTITPTPSPAPTPSTFANASSSAVISASPSAITIAQTSLYEAVVDVSVNSGTIASESDNCKPFAVTSTVLVPNQAEQIGVTPLAGGTCTISLSAADAPTVNVPVTIGLPDSAATTAPLTLAGSQVNTPAFGVGNGFSVNVAVIRNITTADQLLAVSSSLTLPTGAPAVSSLQRRPVSIGSGLTGVLMYVGLRPQQGFSSSPPELSFFFPTELANTLAAAQLYLAEYDPTNSSVGWQTLTGPGTTTNYNGSLVVQFPTEFAPILTFAANQTYYFAVIESDAALTGIEVPGSAGTPAPYIPPEPLPTPTWAGVSVQGLASNEMLNSTGVDAAAETAACAAQATVANGYTAIVPFPATSTELFSGSNQIFYVTTPGASISAEVDECSHGSPSTFVQALPGGTIPIYLSPLVCTLYNVEVSSSSSISRSSNTTFVAPTGSVFWGVLLNAETESIAGAPLSFSGILDTESTGACNNTAPASRARSGPARSAATSVR